MGWPGKDSQGRAVNKDLKEVRRDDKKAFEWREGQERRAGRCPPGPEPCKEAAIGENWARAREGSMRGGLRGPGHREPGGLALGLQILHRVR